MDRHYFSFTSGPRNGVLDSILREILISIRPLEEDRVRRLNVINDFKNVVRSVETLRGAMVEPFGSFVSNLYTKWGDLDISIELPGAFVSSPRKGQKQYLLREIMRALQRRGGASNLEFIPNAKVPLLIFQSNYRNISCDISISNLIGQIKSKCLLWIAEIDDRFRDMVLLVKEWAKAQNINDPKNGTLNSYSLCLLVIFHFQSCTPPILPPLKDIYDGNMVDEVTGIRSTVERRIKNECDAGILEFRNSRRVNRSSLSELFISFFERFSTMSIRSTNYAICTYTGDWVHIMSQAKWMGKIHNLLIEDPFEQPENAARTVGRNQLYEITEAFQRTYNMLSSSSASSDRNSLIANLVHPHIRSVLGNRINHNHSNVDMGGLGLHLQSANGVDAIQHRIQHDLRLVNRPTSSTVSVRRPAESNSQIRPVRRSWN